MFEEFYKSELARRLLLQVFVLCVCVRASVCECACVYFCVCVCVCIMLLLQRYSSIDLEKAAIARLKSECGAAFTTK